MQKMSGKAKALVSLAKKIIPRIGAGAKKVAPAAARVGAGAGTGYLTGRYITPHLLGYQDSPDAVRTSALIDAALGGILGHAAHSKGGFIRGFRSLGELPLKVRAAIPTAFGVGEIAPRVVATLESQRRTAEIAANAARDAADATRSASIPAALSRVIATPEARGAGLGALGAGGMAILSGLLRRQTEKEITQRQTRGGMIRKDFLKYLLPALLAGGVAGSVFKKPTS